MITHSALQHMALLKATHGLAIDTVGVRFHRVTEIARKHTQLTTAEIAILEHFVHSNAEVLKNTVYWEDQIIHPVTHTRADYYKKASTGAFTQRQTGTGQHMRERALARGPRIKAPPKPRGRPRKIPK